MGVGFGFCLGVGLCACLGGCLGLGVGFGFGLGLRGRRLGLGIRLGFCARGLGGCLGLGIRISLALGLSRRFRPFTGLTLLLGALPLRFLSPALGQHLLTLAFGLTIGLARIDQIGLDDGAAAGLNGTRSRPQGRQCKHQHKRQMQADGEPQVARAGGGLGRP